MFERFTPRARRVIVLAQDTARDMGHPQIRPEHLLVGLCEGEGWAARAMSESGVDAAALRQRVAAVQPSRAGAKRVDKVPFSVDGKKGLELALRAALALGHNYIGTEHLFFGVERQAEAGGRTLDALLGVSAGDIHRRLTEMLGRGGSPARRSPALQAALDRARTGAGQSPMTTGHVLASIVSDPDSQVSHALAQIGVDPQDLQAALTAVDVSDTSDASPAPQSVAITVGETTMLIADPDLAAALQHLTTEQLRHAIRRAVEHPDPGPAAS